MSYKFSFNCLKCSAVAVFLLFLQPVFAQGRFAEIESTIEGGKKLFGTDLMVAVANKDTILYQKAFGETNARTQVPIGAASAWFTTALVLQLVDEGKLSLDDKIVQYIPIFGSYAKNYITIRHCLTHMTGIETDPFKQASLTAKRKYNSLEEEVTDFAKKEIQNNAGEVFRYNQMGPTIAARVVEVVTKKKFDQLMRQRIFAPLMMRNTNFTTDDGSVGSPSNGAKTSIADFTRFLQMLLNGGTLGGKKILSPEAIAEMKKIQVPRELMKSSAKGMESYLHTLGVWSVDEAAEEVGATSSVLASPGFLGTWASVDFKKGYAIVVLPKTFTGEQRIEPYLRLKEMLDQIPPGVFKSK